MKLVTYLSTHSPRRARLGALVEDAVVDLEAASHWAQEAAGLSREEMPASMLTLLYAGPQKWDYVRAVVMEVAQAGNPALLTESGQRGIAILRNEAQLLAPLRPLTLRDAYAFEQHVKKANENRGRSVQKEWYEFPIFYYTNSNTVFGDGESIPYPRYTEQLDYELEIAAVIGSHGKDLDEKSAASCIFGYTIFNDWSARDIQHKEMKAGLGPAKGKDFASSLGPCVVTVDELADCATRRAGVYDLTMTARVNGEERSRGNFKDIYWSFGQILARITEEAALYPGDVVGSGTVGTGCLLELTKAEGPWLQAGDVVELEIERIGKLQNRIANTAT